MTPTESPGQPRPDAAIRSSRATILYHLKTRGPQTAADLARRLDITAMAVRQHLQALAEGGLVEFRDERRKVGRPARVWSLLPAASRRFPDTHGDLTVELLQAVRATFGEAGLDRLIGERTRQQKASYLGRIPSAGAPIDQRIEALAAIRRSEGYMAEWSREADGSWLLVENHCPICAAATICQGFCRDELAVFRELLGGDVTVEREEHILAGARRCAYRIRARADAPTHADTPTSHPPGPPGVSA
jgi:predicted ArsR family transcriptional regulator